MIFNLKSGKKVKMSKKIEFNIFLEPDRLGKNYKFFILQKARDLLEGKSNNLHGHIGKVYDDFEILGNSVSNTNPGVYFRVKLEVDCSRPILNKIYDATFQVIGPHIFVRTLDNISVFVARHNLKVPNTEVKMETGLLTLVREKKTTTYRVGDPIKVCIEQIKYTQQKFNCIGKLIF